MHSKLPRIVFVLTMAGHVAFAGTGYVSLSGSNTPPYDSWATAATNIQTAVDAAGDGDTVLVGTGTYTLIYQIVVTNGLTLRSENGEAGTIIDGGGSNRCFYVIHTNALIDGFTIAHGSAYCSFFSPLPHYHGGGMFIDQATVRNCTFRDNEACDMGGGLFAVWATVEGCTFISNSAPNGGGLWGSNSVVRNCVAVWNYADSVGGGIAMSGASSAVQNCTVAFNAAGYQGGGAWIHAGHPVFENSIVYSNNAPMDPNYSGNSDGFWGYSCTYPYTNAPGNIATNPSFVDPAAGDFRLTADSPCIDAGTNAEWTKSSTDIEDGKRVFNSRVDIGAYEASIKGSAVSVSNGAVTAWDAVPKARCQLQRSSNLVSTNWVNVGNVVTASTSSMTISDTNALGGGPAYYRLYWLRQ